MKKPNLSLSLLKEKYKKYKENKDIKKRSLIILTFSIFISFLFISLITQASTTIGNNINTEGTLIVQGRINASSTLQTTGAARFYSTTRIDGATILNSISYTWPSSDGSASTYLQTNGAGTLSWATVSSGANSDWLKQTNFGVLNLTASTTIPYWAKDAIYASSTLQVQGLATLTNASTTQLTNSGLSWFNNLATFTTASTTGSVTIGDASADILTINAGTINYVNSATTTIPQLVNAWSLATSTSATPMFSLNGSTGTINIQDGTVSSPSLTFFNDTNTGLYRFGNNALAISANGGLLARIDENASFFTKLFTHNDAVDSLTNSGTSVNNTDGMTYSASLNAIMSGDLTRGAFHAGLYGTGTSDPDGWYTLIGQRMGGLAWDNTPLALSKGDYLPGIGFAGQSNTTKGTGMEIGAAIHGLIDGTVSTGVLPTSLVFSTTKTNDTGLTERLRITSDGFIGIGTSTPTTMFQVATSTANATTTVEFGKANQNKGSCLKLYDSAGTVYYCRIDGGTFTCNTTSCE